MSSTPDKQQHQTQNFENPEDIQVLPNDMIRVPVKQHDPTNVVLQKGKHNKESYGLRLGTRLYIEDIQANSLAERSGNLNTGDLIIMINNRSTDNLTVAEAIQLITKTKDRLQITVQRASGGTVTIPTSMSRPASRAASRVQSRAASPEPVDHELKPGTTHHYVEPTAAPRSKGPSRAASNKNLHEPGFGVDMNAVAAALPAATQQHRQTTAAPTNYGYDNSREIHFHKGKTVGIRLVGGNDTGLFVASVQEGSPAAQAGLQEGDQLLQVNDEDFKGRTREEAVTMLMGLPIGNTVKIKARASDRETYEPILMKSSGDCFYVKANFRYEPPNNEMEVCRGSVYCVKDTLYKGQFGKWHACELDEGNREVNYGIIPSATRAEQLKNNQDRKEQQRREKHGARKIKERLLKGNSQPSRTAQPQAAVNMPAYERVVLREASFKRPVIIFGAIADIARKMLCSDHPQQYENAQVSNSNQPQKSGRRGIVKISSINSIIECDRHAVVDVTPTASEKLNKARLYPIVIFLRIKDKGQVKELRSRYGVDDKEKSKSSKKMFQRAIKLEKGYGHVFSSIVDVSQDVASWYRRLQMEIRKLQSSLVWVNDDIHPDDAEDRIIDDDRISMISAPDSQYSCTTIGSEMARSRLNLNDFSDDESEHQSGGSSAGQKPQYQYQQSTQQVAAAPYQQQNNTPYQSSQPQHSSLQASRSFNQDDLMADDPPPPPGPAPIPPKKDYTQNPAQAALANVIQGKAPTENNSNFLQSHIKNNLGNRPTPVSQLRSQPQYQQPPLERASTPPQPVYSSYTPGGELASRVQQSEYQNTENVIKKVHPPHTFGANNNGVTQRLNKFKEPDQQSPQQFTYSPRNQVSFDNKPQLPAKPTAKPQLPAKPQKTPYGEYIKNLRNQPYANKYGAASNLPATGSGASAASLGSSGGQSNYSQQQAIPVNPHQIEEVEEGHEVIATARGTFDHLGGLLTNPETGVQISVPPGAIPQNVKQEIYFKVCREINAEGNASEQLLSPMVMCGPHGLKFTTPVELRLPHSANISEQGWQVGSNGGGSGTGSDSNQVSVLIDHF